ncbi:hypothetical protein FOXG_21670 [Fusarium oxysporum f. sp. lycopersici 4287]|uniref:Uncharacterized protein n=1 Tax=Fusarium oxysporum f. sp. lycopersici (strain 4287 / CBS 123668 / FGSC 9935 / NRRL 34936) TaxID=426428 RepID=A0A0J9WTQ5_FUSO4|nr:hypothetical protein FOXG_21670 [Fusarium oxysporum f. sp. lycopersici 4287]KNB16442.1 hypothetical protein FOXG_21670 [Fusarium oxysporum f. sp. lycopersici 4287]
MSAPAFNAQVGMMPCALTLPKTTSCPSVTMSYTPVLVQKWQQLTLAKRLITSR